MRSPSDPARSVRRWTHLTAAMGVAVACACGVWAFRPLGAHPAAELSIEAPEAGALDAPLAVAASLDSQAFEAPIWNPIRPRHRLARPEDRTAVRPPPMKLQLISVIQSEGGLSAAIYDPDQDRLFIVTEGDEVGGFTVRAVTGELVSLARGGGAHELRLREERLP